VCRLNLMGRVVFISGGTASIRSETYTYVSSQHRILIRQEDYLLRDEDKPRVILPNGKEVRNWDTVRALDIDRFNNDILYSRIYSPQITIVEGFCLSADIMKVIPDMHIHLSYIGSEKKEDSMAPYNFHLIEKRMLASPKEFKHDIDDEELIIKCIIIPFYVRTLENSNITHIVPTFLGDLKIHADLVEGRIFELISSLYN